MGFKPMGFKARKKVFVYWVSSFLTPIVILLLLIYLCFFYQLFSWQTIKIVGGLLLVVLVGFLVFLGLDYYCSILIIDNDGVRFNSWLRARYLRWSEIKEAVIINPGNVLYVIPKRDRVKKTTIEYQLSMLLPEDQKLIEEMLREKTNLRIESSRLYI